MGPTDHHELRLPFSRENDLVSASTSASHLPGYPLIPGDGPGLWAFLSTEFCSDDLDRVAPRLWWMSKQDSQNISPLHRQLVKRRNIILTEDPKLHLVWFYDRIYIKPLPRYILSYTFWKDHLSQAFDDKELRTRIHKAALGYLRTYARLVRYESDFRIAQDPALCLIPAGITWEQFCNFASDLEKIEDREVSERYAYGEIRLTRLNFYAPILLGKSHYQRMEYQYGTYFARFFGPLLFVIGIITVVLTGLQLLLAAESNDNKEWAGVVLGISVFAVVGASGVFFGLVLVWVYKVAREWRFAIRDRLRLLEEKRAVE